MQQDARMELRPIGWVSSPLSDPADAPKQGDEGAPIAELVLEPPFLEGLHGIQTGDAILVLTWLDRADRDVLSVHPRGDPERERQGVFATRSPHRPNPIGLHRVRVESIDRGRVQVSDLEALDGTPVIDLKPLLSAEIDER
jgi:tRNA-Thr(GGU) m(6)t(6)A37 methyltransferase TsaA